MRHGLPVNERERTASLMEAQGQAARLLTWRAAWMIDQGIKNNLETSMCKAKAGLVGCRRWRAHDGETSCNAIAATTWGAAARWLRPVPE